MTIEYTGSIKGSVRKHTDDSLKATFDHAYCVIPNPGVHRLSANYPHFLLSKACILSFSSCTAAPA